MKRNRRAPPRRVAGTRDNAGGVTLQFREVFEPSAKYRHNASNAMLHLFDSLEIVHHDVVRDKGDFADRRVTDVMRLVARKP